MERIDANPWRFTVPEKSLGLKWKVEDIKNNQARQQENETSTDGLESIQQQEQSECTPSHHSSFIASDGPTCSDSGSDPVSADNLNDSLAAMEEAQALNADDVAIAISDASSSEYQACASLIQFIEQAPPNESLVNASLYAARDDLLTPLSLTVCEAKKAPRSTAIAALHGLLTQRLHDDEPDLPEAVKDAMQSVAQQWEDGFVAAIVQDFCGRDIGSELGSAFAHLCKQVDTAGELSTTVLHCLANSRQQLSEGHATIIETLVRDVVQADAAQQSGVSVDEIAVKLIDAACASTQILSGSIRLAKAVMQLVTYCKQATQPKHAQLLQLVDQMHASLRRSIKAALQ